MNPQTEKCFFNRLLDALEKVSANTLNVIPENLRKIALNYLSVKYLGKYLTHNITLDQLYCNLAERRVGIKDLVINVDAINVQLEQFNLPFIFVDVYLDDFSLYFNRKVISDSCFIEISGLKLIIHPKQRDEACSILIDSMMESMSTSMQIAQEIAQEADYNTCRNDKKSTPESSKNEKISGGSTEIIEMLANFIDSFFTKIKIRLVDSVIRIESLPKSSHSGIALEIKINQIDFFDEASFQIEYENLDENKEKKRVDLSSVISKKFIIQGLTIYTDEFSIPSSENSDDEFHDTFNKSTLSNLNDSDEHESDEYESDKQKFLESLPSGNTVLIAKLYNIQEIKLQFRKPDVIDGPRSKIEVNLGCLITLLSPRQIYLIMELMERIYSPEAIDQSNVVNRKPKDLQKPMNQNDFKNIDEDVMKRVSSPNFIQNNALNHDNWSSYPFYNYDDDSFIPVNSDIKEPSVTMINSALTDLSDLEASFTSTASSHIINNNKKDDIFAEFKIRLNSFCLVILHEDVIIPSNDKDEVVTPASIQMMKSKCELYYTSMKYNRHLKNGHEDFQDLNEKVLSACLDNHFSFIGTSVLVEGNKKHNSNYWHQNASISIGRLEIKECLIEPDKDSTMYSELLSFEKVDPLLSINQFQLTLKPNVQISINYYVPIKNSRRSHKMSSPKVDIHILLDNCKTEIDISMLDRLYWLLKNQDVMLKKDDYITADKSPPSCLDNQAFFKDLEENSISETKTKIKIEGSMITMKVYFPIPDLRPGSCMNRISWWKRNVRKELMIINLNNFSFFSNICAECPTNFDMLSKNIEILFQETKDIPPVQILTASGAKEGKEFFPVSISVTSFPVKTGTNLEDKTTSENEVLNESSMGFQFEVNKGAPDLFSKRSVATSYESKFNDLTIPSAKDVINKFINETLSDVQYKIFINLVNVKFILPSKHIYELLYNRISDVLLWTPSAPKGIVKPSVGTTLIPNSYDHSFDFKPFITLENDDESDNEFASVYEQTCLNPKRNNSMRPAGQTFVGIKVNIENATGSIHTPYRDENNKIVPGKFGDISFTFNNGNIFVASGYKGDVNDIQGSMTLKTVHVYHKPENKISYSPIKLDSEFLLTVRKLENILHPTDFSCRIEGGDTTIDKEKECVNISFKSNFDMLKNENIFKLTGNLYCLTLRYFVTNAAESWTSQIQDMFNIDDYPVEGYTIPDCITEINFHFEFCGIDYRPLNLSLRSYIAFDTLAISSNFTVKGNSSVMMFIIEDAALFLSQNPKSKRVLLKKDYVCIIDISVFEIYFKKAYSSLNIPITELIFSNNKIHIRTCADSCKAFMELLIYLSNGEDLVKNLPTAKCDLEKNVVIEPSTMEEVAHLQCSKNTLTNQQTHIACMMKEAMMDCDNTNASHDKPTMNNKDTIVDEFCFPGENFEDKEIQSNVETEITEALKEETKIYTDRNLDWSDEEFCILDDIPGTGIQSPTGRPEAKYVDAECISIHEGYFDTSTNEYEVHSIHQKHFQQVNCKYDLKEMSIIWYMYGGNDFTTDDNCDEDNNGNTYRNVKKTRNSPQIGNRSSDVLYNKGNANGIADQCSVILPPGSAATVPQLVKWFTDGGPNRRHDMLLAIHLTKIKLKYESYSDDCPYVSQHVFTVNDIQIVDHFPTSNYNKFLSQYCSEAFPIQASSNMIQVRAISRKSDPIYLYETNLSISCKPMKLIIDQDPFDFLLNFIDDIFVNIESNSESGAQESSHNVQIPVMSLKNNELDSHKQEIYYNLSKDTDLENKPNNGLIYFNNVVFFPDVPIKLDYNGKRIDIRSEHGPIVGLLFRICLENSQITLKSIKCKSGVLGINKVLSTLGNEWLDDIKKNQYMSIAKGFAAAAPLCEIYNGAKDLIRHPYNQYNKDGRLFRGIQKGTSSFTSSSALAVLNLTTRFVSTIQSTAETMHDMVSSGPSVKDKTYKTRRGQPKDIREGITTAYGLVRSGLEDTASTLIKVATEEHSHKGVSGAVGGVLRQIPPSIIVKPIIIATEATCTLLGGMTNQLIPGARKEAADKWK